MLSLPSGMYVLFLIFGVSFFIAVLAIADGTLFEFGSRMAKNFIVGGVLGGALAITFIDLPALSSLIAWLPK